MIDSQSRAFFEEMLATPSPTGQEERVQEVVRRFASQFADQVRTDTHGNVIATANPGGTLRVLLDGHCDQIGLLVSHIDDNGFLHCQPLGGWDAMVLLGQRVTVWAAGGPVPGVIARKPKHLLKPEEMKQVPEIHEMWIDIGAKDKADAESAVRHGDGVTMQLGIHEMRNGLVSATKMDDTTGVFVVFEALKRLRGHQFAPAVHVVSAVAEEIGLRGAQTAAYGVDPHVGIAVDVTHATDCPTIDKKLLGDVKLGGGPVVYRGPNVSPVVFRQLEAAAKARSIPIQVRAAARGMSNDTNVIQLTRAGVATACVGIPNRYMHSPVEMCSLADLDHAAELLAQAILAMPADLDLIPRVG